MKFGKPLSAFSLAALASAFLLAGCQSREDRARGAFDQYQAATAAGNLTAARRALLQLVTEDDSNSNYWVELGKTQLALGDFGGAYNAFIRAHELDRANPEVLAVLTQISLRSGNLARAQEHARELELVAPDDPAVRLTYGYVALRRGDIAGANDQVVKLLEATPYDPSAKVLLSRILLQSGKPDEAIASLREQVRLQPSDVQGLLALLDIYERRDQWREASDALRSLINWQPKNKELHARLVENELRASRVPVALSETARGLIDADPQQIERLLAPWGSTGNEAVVAARAFDVARAASGERRLALARFLAFHEKPNLALVLTRDLATQPVKPVNLAANALFGAALVQTSQKEAGLERLNAVLALDPGNSDALRGRADAFSKAGHHKQAIEDARKLVSTSRASAKARLLLAHIYVAAGQPEDAKRTLWDAFHDIPADRTIYLMLRSVIVKSEGSSAVGRLDEEFEDQRDVVMSRSFA